MGFTSLTLVAMPLTVTSCPMLWALTSLRGTAWLALALEDPRATPPVAGRILTSYLLRRSRGTLLAASAAFAAPGPAGLDPSPVWFCSAVWVGRP